MREGRTANFYAVLEVLPTATSEDIKKAWQEQMQVWHPDRFTHSPTLHRKAEVRTQLINQAYQTLSDPGARTRYDATSQPASSPTHTARPSPPPASPRPQPPPRPRQELRGPQSLITLSREGRPKSECPPSSCSSTALSNNRMSFEDTFESPAPFGRHSRPATMRLLKHRTSCV